MVMIGIHARGAGADLRIENVVHEPPGNPGEKTRRGPRFPIGIRNRGAVLSTLSPKRPNPMQTETFSFGSDDGTPIFTYAWRADGDGAPSAVVQIAHGMAEHAGRYARFAEALTRAGFAVYANDHRGHGRTVKNPLERGYFGDANGWYRVVGDMARLTERIRERHPGLPVWLFGHSMGSFLARAYISRHGEGLSGVVLCGTGGNPGFMGTVGRWIAAFECLRKGRRGPSPLLTSLSLGDFNKPFRPNRTDFDWLSRDPAEVDRYVADPLCGGVFTAGFYADMIGGIMDLYRSAEIAAIPRDLPILLISGERDPMGKNTRAVNAVAESYTAAGIRDVTVRFYEGARHELLNETNRDEVTSEVINWMKDRC